MRTSTFATTDATISVSFALLQGIEKQGKRGLLGSL